MKKMKAIGIFLVVTLVAQEPLAYAIFGTRIARRAIGARRAAQMTSSQETGKAQARRPENTSMKLDENKSEPSSGYSTTSL